MLFQWPYDYLNSILIPTKENDGLRYAHVLLCIMGAT